MIYIPRKTWYIFEYTVFMIASQTIALFFTISFEHHLQSELQKKAKEYLEAKSGGGEDDSSKQKGKKRKRRGSGDSDGSDVSSDDEDEAPPGMKDQEELDKKVNIHALKLDSGPTGLGPEMQLIAQGDPGGLVLTLDSGHLQLLNWPLT